MASTFTAKTAEQIRDDILRTIRSGLIQIGVEDPNVTPGSDEYIRAQALGDQLEIAMANAQVKADAMMPDTATGDDLDRVLAVYGLTRRAAGGSVGNVTLSSTAASTIVAGTQLIDGAGLRFAVTTSGSYANGATVPVAAVDTGKATNHAAGDTLRWVTIPPFSASSALVATGGLTGAVDAEDDETARERLYARLRTPPGAGNWEHVAEIVEASSTLVQKAFVYPAVNGPGNVGVAVVGYATTASKSRVISSTIVTNVIKPYLDGLYPEHVDTIVTSVVDVNFDAGIALSLPAATTAMPAGPGGGWSNGTTWPRPNTTNSYGYCDVTAVTSSTVFRVRSENAPTAGVTQIAWLSPTDWTVRTATVTGVSAISTYVFEITIDKPFTGIAVGCFVSPNAVNISAYFTALLDHFAAMGPGEKIASTSAAFVRGFRHPTPAVSWPMQVNSTMLRALTDAGDEVLDADWLSRTATTSPSVPGAVSTAPNIYVPRHLGLYEKLT